MQPTVIVKLGGSVLTIRHADGPQLNAGLLDQLARELSAQSGLVVVHGSGTFGKPPAIAHGYVGGRLPASALPTVIAVTQDLERLQRAVIERLRAQGVSAFPIAAAHLFHWQHQRVRLSTIEPLRALLARGVTPVVASGFVADRDAGGFAVCSSDAMACELALALGAQRLLFATDVPGVYASRPGDGDVLDALAADERDALARISRSEGDVTGGMAEKLAQGFRAAGEGVATWVIDGRMSGNLAASLKGRPLAGTRLFHSTSELAPSARPDPMASARAMTSSPTVAPSAGLAADADAMRMRIDDEMRRLFQRLVVAGPMARDPLVRQVYRWSEHYLHSGGRRMHGVAVWMAYRAFGGKDEAAILKVAAAVQLYHHHTMVHDDVYDEDVARRRWPTTHVAFADWFAARQGATSGAPTRLFGSDASRRGAVAAIAYGKIMRALGLYGIGTAGFDERATLDASNLLNWHDLFDCAGQMKDVDFESKQLPDSQACLNNAWLKTGRLFEVCARIGAMLAGAGAEQQDAAARWAGNAGVAYQIQDDLEDIVERSEKGVGRGVGVDLLYCKPTYLYALTRELATGEDRDTLARWEAGQRTREGVAAIIAVIERSGARQRVEEKVGQLLDEGCDALRACALAPHAVQAMDAFARYFVSADYWQRPLADGNAQLLAIFERDQPGPEAPSYPRSHRESAVHGIAQG